MARGEKIRELITSAEEVAARKPVTTKVAETMEQ
jgi:hypothetical protein